MGRKKSINLEVFLDLYERFTAIATWTKEKHERFDEVQQYLRKHKVVTIRVKPHSKYNHCEGTHSFTIIRVPNDQLGNLYRLRNEWVLIRCVSDVQSGWSQYFNEVYLLDSPLDLSKRSTIEKRFRNYFIN
jgi:hypothetical protein